MTYHRVDGLAPRLSQTPNSIKLTRDRWCYAMLGTARHARMTSLVSNFVTWGAGGIRTVRHLKTGSRVLEVGVKAERDVCDEVQRNDCRRERIPKTMSLVRVICLVVLVVVIIIIISRLGNGCEFCIIPRDCPLQVIREAVAGFLPCELLDHLLDIVLFVADAILRSQCEVARDSLCCIHLRNRAR